MLNLKGNRITYFGHSTFSITTPSGQIALIDPWVQTNPRCPKELKKMDRLDFIFLTHAHSDHFGDLPALAKKFRPKLVASFETCIWLDNQGFGKLTAPMGKGGSQKVGEFHITMTHAMHSNSIEVDGKAIYGGEPAGYIVRLPGDISLYHAGDTAVFGDMKLIAQLYQPQIAMLPIGDLFTMGPAEASVAAGLLGAKTVIPMHYATFPQLTGTPEEFQRETKDIAGLSVVVMQPGDSLGEAQVRSAAN
jgi:L-ascorbate metabolism protein UlaG (beta-lactamase superfamily)